MFTRYFNFRRRRLTTIAIAILLIFCCFGCDSSGKNHDTAKAEGIEVENLFEDGLEEIIEDDSAGQDTNYSTDESVGHTNDFGNDISDTDVSEEVEPGRISDELLPRKSVDLIFFMGQSNMSGNGGDASKAPTVSTEAGEEFRAFSDRSRLYPIEEPFGIYESNPDGLAEKASGKKGSLVSAFVNEYHELSEHKVIAVSISVGGMAMDLWLKSPFFEDAGKRVSDALLYLDENGYRADNVFIVWLQGESDAIHQKAPELYREEFENFMGAMMDEGVDHVFVITPGRMVSNKNAYSSIIEMQKRICEDDDFCSLATDCMSDFDTSFMVDEYHYNQDALNTIGREAAKGVFDFVSLQF